MIIILILQLLLIIIIWLQEEKNLAVVKIRRSIFQGDEFSPLLFVIGIMSHILRNCTEATHFLTRKNQPPNIHEWHQPICKKKWKTIGDSNKNNRNIQSGYNNGIWHKEISDAYYEMGKRTKNKIKQPNQERIRILGVKEIYKYMEYWKKIASKKKRKKKSISDEWENLLKPSTAAAAKISTKA